MKMLRENYLCTWSLPGELEDIKASSQSGHARDVAGVLLSKYRPLVEIIRLDSKGRFQGRLSMNEDIINRFQSSHEPTPEEIAFLSRFLAAGLKK